MRVPSASIVCNALLFVCLTGCAQEPVSYSAPIGINFKADDGDVAATGVIQVDKAITTESGNPWAAFIAGAELEIGAFPGDIDMTALTLLLSANSEGVTELREVFNGAMDVQFEMNDTKNLYPAASGSIGVDLAGREVGLSPSFDFAALGPADVEKLRQGSFKVVMAGPAEAGFAAKNAKAELQLTFVFSAYE